MANPLLEPVAAAISTALPLLKKNNGEFEGVTAIFYDANNSTKTVVRAFDNNEEQTLFEPVKILSTNKTISSKYSDEFIRKTVIDHYHDLLLKKEEYHHAERLLALFETEAKEYTIISEIENIEVIDEGEYEFLDCTIKKLCEEDVKETGKFLLPKKESMMGKNIIVTKVKAGDSEKASEFAIKNFRTSLSLLRVYFIFLETDLKGCLLTGRRDLIIIEESKQIFRASMVGTKNYNKIHLNKALYDQLAQEGIIFLQKRSSIRNVIETSLYWYGAGLREENPAARILNFITVLEAILKKPQENTEITRTISERGALLLHSHPMGREVVRKHLRDIYRTRSKIVHNGKLDVDKDHANYSAGYAQAIIKELIRRSPAFNGNFNDLIDYLDTLKMRGTFSVEEYLKEKKQKGV
jgi:hypothetical protein